jgi:amino acid adenylation domain-containing protein/non-ribosomal peptide synthase protein (TIGR01720 family)
LAYTIYTSGSTGQPKGVQLQHRGLTNLVWAQKEGFGLQARHRILQFASFSFDAAVSEIFMALCTGAELVLAPQEKLTPGVALLDLLRDEGINVVTLPPTLLSLLEPAPLPALEIVISAGEACSWEIVDRWATGRRFINAYGPTEATVGPTFCDLNDLEKRPMTVPIGRPIGNVRAYILDSHGQLSPVGVSGELYLGGECVARGYQNQAGLTAEKFIPDPFSKNGGKRLYRTGDRARLLSDGTIEFLGRIDHQVKVRGFRIELGEIEAVLAQHADVQKAVVVARDGSQGGKRLIAYLIPDPEKQPGRGDLRNFVMRKLPDYMAPSAYVMLDAFPLNANGKVDRKALPAPPDASSVTDEPYVAPRTSLEQHLVGRFQEVLEVEQVGVYDNFFELGGNSLVAAVLANRLQEDMEETAHVRAIFLAPTVAELALHMQEYYPEAVSRITGSAPEVKTDNTLKKEINAVQRKLNGATVERMRALIPSIPSRPEDAISAKGNPPATFILSPPRSGSTLLRVMLEGSQELFCPPELDLLSFDTLGERKRTFTGQYDIWLEGAIRAIMEAKGMTVDDATAFMANLEEQDLAISTFYRQLQSWIGERMLVDKTPVYALDRAVLQRAEAYFDNAYYIHLIRHPYASIYSFLEGHLEELFFRYEHPFSRRELAELIWIVSHQNILGFLKNIPDERKISVRFEELVRQPERTMRAICSTLNIRYDARMIDPYDGDRMTTGLQPEKQMAGDFKFYLRKRIDPSVADRWKRFHEIDFLGDVTVELAHRLGYDISTESQTPQPSPAFAPIPIAPRSDALQLSYGQQRLWFLDQLAPDTPLYNIAPAIEMSGKLDVTALERSLNEIVQRHEVLRTTFPTIDGKAAVAIAPNLHLPLEQIDLSGSPAAEQKDEMQRLVADYAQRPFELDKGPLLRVYLVRLAPERHIFLLVMHHIVADGWSMNVLIRELAILYQDFVLKRPSSLPDLPIQYVDYAQWQRQWLQGEALQEQLDYWKKQLGGAPTLLELPTDHARPAMQTYRGLRRRFRLPQAVGERLTAVGRRRDATLFMTLLAAFHVLMYRYTRQESISVGTPIANRNRTEIEPLIGFFVNTLVIRTDMTGDLSFLELLERVRDTALAAYAHHDLPFEMLVDALQPERELSHSPLFQVMFGLQTAPTEALELPDLRLSPLVLDMGTAKFDLTLSVTEREDGLGGMIEYNSALFEADTIERMVQHWQTLLSAIAADPDQPIGDLAMLTPTELAQFRDWNDTATPAPSEACAHTLFERQVQRTPDAVALRFVGDSVQELTYDQLNRRANQLAHFLQELGISPDQPVGICVERSLEMIVGLLGVLKAGGAYMPIDPNYPDERIEYMLEDSGVSVLLTQSETRSQSLVLSSSKGAEDELRILCLDTLDLSTRPSRNPNAPIHPDNLAYVIYTSGSTGRPKGVQLHHRGLVNFIDNWSRTTAVETNSHILQFASFSFDAAIAEIFVALPNGARLVLTPSETFASGSTLLELLREEAISVVIFPPTLLSALNPKNLPDLHTLISAGEACTWDIVDRWTSGRRFGNGYGPTETTVGSSACLVDELHHRPRTVPIGKPFANVQYHILDARLQPVPVGVMGELFIGGTGVARGYLNQPGLTAECFLPDPYAGNPGVRMYRTGDLARYLPDGKVEFLGRVDQQVKVRGFRIELGEIESALRQHEQVDEVIVMVREDAPGVRRIAAYLTPAGDVEPDVDELRSRLARRLPEYMHPSAMVVLDEFPLTPNLKVDRKALPAPTVVQTGPEVERRTPRTPEEKTLVRVWLDILGIEDIGVHDNFFELGGDSILSIQVIARAQQAGLHFKPKQLFQNPTIAELAAVAETDAAVRAEQGPVTGPVALTPIQQWFFEQDFAEPHHWNQSILLETDQRLDPALLEQAVQHLLDHHDALRMRFERTPAGWVQHNGGDASTTVAVFDLSQRQRDEQVQALEVHCAELQASLNLHAGPLLRVGYFDMGNGSGRLLMIVHHLVIDGVSWRILMEDLQAIYSQLRRAEPVQLPPKTTSYRTWARHLREFSQSEALRAELSYWLQLRDAHTASLLQGNASPGITPDERSIQHQGIQLSREQTRVLLQETQAIYGADVVDALLSGLVLAVGEWQGDARLLLHLEGHGREDALGDVDVSRTVGWFTSLYPAYLDLTGVQNPGGALMAVKQQMRSIPQRGLGFGLLRYLHEDADVRAQLASLPQPVVIFNYLGQFEQDKGDASAFTAASESKGPERSLQAHRPYLLDVTASVVDGALRLKIAYDPRLHKPAAIETLLQAYSRALHDLIEHCLSQVTPDYTPYDFPEAELTQENLEAVLSELGEQMFV